MFFCIHPDSVTRVTGFIGFNREIYWLASDVAGLFLQRKFAKTDLCLEDVLPDGWNLPTFGYNRKLRLISSDRLKKMCTIRGQMFPVRSPAYRFSAWILHEDGDNEDMVPKAKPMHRFQEIMNNPLLSAREARMPLVKLVGRGGKYSFDDVIIMLQFAAGKIYRMLSRMQGWRSAKNCVSPDFPLLDDEVLNDVSELSDSSRVGANRNEFRTRMVPPSDFSYLDDSSSDDSSSIETDISPDETEEAVGDFGNVPNSSVDNFVTNGSLQKLKLDFSCIGFMCYPSVSTSVIQAYDGTKYTVPDSFVALRRDAAFLYKRVQDVTDSIFELQDVNNVSVVSMYENE